jgi:hypothetical protein
MTWNNIIATLTVEVIVAFDIIVGFDVLLVALLSPSIATRCEEHLWNFSELYSKEYTFPLLLSLLFIVSLSLPLQTSSPPLS